MTTDLQMASTTRSQFAYVAKCSRNIPSWSEFYLQSRTMQQRLQLPSDTLWVSSVEFSDLKSILDYRVRLATLLHTDQQTHDILSSIESVKVELLRVKDTILRSQQDLKGKIGEVAVVIITNMGFSNENFVGKAADAQAELEDAKSSAMKLELNFYVSILPVGFPPWIRSNPQN